MNTTLSANVQQLAMEYAYALVAFNQALADTTATSRGPVRTATYNVCCAQGALNDACSAENAVTYS